MHKLQTWTLWLFAIGVFMAALDNGIITAALTTLTSSFGVTPTWGAWSITIYTLGLAVSVPIVGKMSDRFGRKRLFLLEVFLFGLGSLLVALSPNFEWFLIARMLQALGGGGIFIIASAYVLNVFPRESHGKALGMLGGMNGMAAVLGPNIGSFILELTGSWHWLFLINLPIALFLVIFGWKLISEQVESKQSKIDWIGISLLSLGILFFMYGLTKLDGVNVLRSLTQFNVCGWFVGGITCLIILGVLEIRLKRNGGDPFLPVTLFGFVRFRLSLVLGFLSGAILAAVIFIPSFVEQFLGVDSATAGYWFTPLALASGIGAGGGGSLVDKKGSVFTLILASTLCLFGFSLFPLWVSEGWQLIVASCIVGLGFGMMLGAPINVIATEQAQNDKGIALSTLSLSRQIGLTLFPTLYAGFLARSLIDWSHDELVPSIKYLDVPMQYSGGEGMIINSAGLKSMLAMIPDQASSIKQHLALTFHSAVQHGYDGLYWSAVGLSGVALLVTLMFFMTKVPSVLSGDENRKTKK